MRIIFKIDMRISRGTRSNWNFLTHLLLTRTDKEGDNWSAWPDSKKFQPQGRKECHGKRLSTAQALNVAFPITSCFHSHCLFCFLKARKKNYWVEQQLLQQEELHSNFSRPLPFPCISPKHGLCTEVRGQLSGVGPALPSLHMVPGHWTRAVRLGGKCLCSLSHLIASHHSYEQLTIGIYWNNRDLGDKATTQSFWKVRPQSEAGPLAARAPLVKELPFVESYPRGRPHGHFHCSTDWLQNGLVLVFQGTIFCLFVCFF